MYVGSPPMPNLFLNELILLIVIFLMIMEEDHRNLDEIPLFIGIIEFIHIY